MLSEKFIVKTTPQADERNFVYWQDYRVTVLGERLFRIEKSPSKEYRDEATQAVWYRNTPPQEYKLFSDDVHAVIETAACRLTLYKDRVRASIEVDGKRRMLDNYGNLLGTYRTLDCCDGDVHFVDWIEGDVPKKIQLGKGVCSKTGVAVLDDSDSYTFGEDGQVKMQKAKGTDEYVFAYGEDYRGAVRALYMLTGRTALIPRYALGNWWSRYYAYTENEYMRVLNRFEDRNVPFSVATVDMDWHYSTDVDERAKVTASGRNTPEFVGTPEVNLGWTGYSWNRYLFPDPKRFLNGLHARGMKVTLNLHPSDGFRYWEDCYENMATAMGMDATKGLHVPFDFTYDRFINCYFDLAHAPLEAQGVDFWWIDWQQKDIPWHDFRPDWLKEREPMTAMYDPLWALNHYHFFNAQSKHSQPLILSRYAGIGSHRYPVGFSGDTEITWKTLAYLPYFTATASNVGYTWWSHDIGGHHRGEKSNELFVRHLQYGVFSPITRLHCNSNDTMTKEPWAYGNGSELIIEEFLRLRHKLVPYLYNANYLNCVAGTALVEPLYYEWQDKQAYSYKEEYRFGSEMLVAPVTQKLYPDGYARVRVWLPQGKWTDIFTGDEYEAGVGGKEIVMLRGLQSIPVLAREGAIIPLSGDNKNAVKNPEKMEVDVYEGSNTYSLYEDGLEDGKYAMLMTEFKSEFAEANGACTQSLIIFSHGEKSVVPQTRTLKVRFKNVEDGTVRLFVNGELQPCEARLSDCIEANFAYDPQKTYRVELIYPAKTRIQKLIARAQKILSEAECGNYAKEKAWWVIKQATNEAEYAYYVDHVALESAIKHRLKETL